MQSLDALVARAASQSAPRPSDRALNAELVPYQQANTQKAIWQIVNSVLPLIICTYAAWLASADYLWLSIALAVVCGWLLLRIGCIQHDCRHYSFFANRNANDWVGVFCSGFSLIPYLWYRRIHLQHHAVANDLDWRGYDIYSNCLTVEEYQALSPRRQLTYRIMRWPPILFFVLPPFAMLVLFRFPFDTPKHLKKERRGTQWTNLYAAALVALFVLAFGWRFLWFYFLSVSIAAALVFGINYFHHQYEASRWFRHGSANSSRMALEGSSYVKLPKVLRWFTASLCLHHIHHLRPRIPFYNLARCQDEVAAFREVPVMTLRTTLFAKHLHLWDEEHGRMVSFGDLSNAGAAQLAASQSAP